MKLILISIIVLILIVVSIFISSKYLYSDQKPKLTKADACSKFQDLGSKQSCWEDLIGNTLQKEDLDSAFSLVDSLYGSEPQFASDCHGYTHQLGQKAYELFSQKHEIKLSSKASYCGFGFYHAFMETLLRTSGDLSQAREFCDFVGKQSEQNELSRLSCFHGIGHGLLEDVPNPTLKGDAEAIIEKPLAICVELSKSEVETYRCASGVFNVLAIYYGNPQAGLAVKKDDPYLICHTLPSRPFKESCYDQMNSFVLSLAKGDLSRAAQYTDSIREDDLASAAIHGLAGAYGQGNVAKVNYNDVVNLCQNLAPRLIPSCLEGFLLGMIEGGKPGSEYIEAAKFCGSELMMETEKQKCFNNVVWNIKVTNPQKLAEICNSLKPSYRLNCNAN